eukprot:1156035-Pelagomonas_calceolata.AAC.5
MAAPAGKRAAGVLHASGCPKEAMFQALQLQSGIMVQVSKLLGIFNFNSLESPVCVVKEVAHGLFNCLHDVSGLNSVPCQQSYGSSSLPSCFFSPPQELERIHVDKMSKLRNREEETSDRLKRQQAPNWAPCRIPAALCSYMHPSFKGCGMPAALCSFMRNGVPAGRWRLWPLSTASASYARRWGTSRSIEMASILVVREMRKKHFCCAEENGAKVGQAIGAEDGYCNEQWMEIANKWPKVNGSSGKEWQPSCK